MADITRHKVSQSLFTWLQSSTLADDFHSGEPQDFDPNREDTKEWVFIEVKKFKRKKHSQAGQEHFDIEIEASVKGRDQGYALGASSMASKVTECLTMTKIPVYDYEATGDPQVGWISLHEATEVSEKDKTWQSIRISITGVVQNLE